MDREEFGGCGGGGGGGEEEVGFEPWLLPWQHLGVRRGKCPRLQLICTVNTAESRAAALSASPQHDTIEEHIFLFEGETF